MPASCFFKQWNRGVPTSFLTFVEIVKRSNFMVHKSRLLVTCFVLRNMNFFNSLVEMGVILNFFKVLFTY